MTKQYISKFFEEVGVDQNLFWQTICTYIYVLNFSRGMRDVDRDGRRNTCHISFSINTVCIKWNYGMIDYLTQSRSKNILFNSFNLWEKIRAVMHIILGFFGTIHGFDDSFVWRQSLMEEIMWTRQQSGSHGPENRIILALWWGKRIEIGGRVKRNLIHNLYFW